MAKSDLDRDSLKIGDYVVLNDVALNCFLSVEGILLEDVVGIDHMTSIHDAIFCVHLQRQYSASRELNAFLEKYSMDKRIIVEESEINYLKALERGTDNENKLNDNYMRKKRGQVVLFGDFIQLFHVKSGKYLQVIPGKLAKAERENVRVGLDPSGNAYCWLQVQPRFKIDKEGDRILSNIEVYMKVPERGSEFIHSADRNPAPGSDREINCSLESTSWRLNIFQSSSDIIDKRLLLASQLVFIHDPETLSNVSIADRKVESLAEEAATVRDFEDLDEEESGPEYEDGDEERVVLLPSHEGQLNSNFLWFMEAVTVYVGGPVKWKTEQVRFKHMNSGLYLCLDTQHSQESTGKALRYSTTPEVDAANALFSINELNSTAKYLASGKACQIGQNGVWMERGEILAGSVSTFKLLATRSQSSAVSMVINRFGGDSKENGSGGEKGGDSEDALEEVEEEEGTTEPLDVFVGLAARHFLQKFYHMTHFRPNMSSNTIWPSASRLDMELFKMIVAKTVIFAQGFPISSNDMKIGIDISNAEQRRSRQNLLREQGTLEVVLRMINKLVPMSSTSPKIRDLDSSFLVKMGRTVLELCFTVLFNGIQDNQENQMYVADFMPVLLAHLNTQPIAVQCVTEMLSKNLELQETKIGTREIQIFVDKLRSSNMNAMYLQLLQACCSCQGKGVDGNQCKVANMLFDGDSSDIIIQLVVDFRTAKKTPWAGDVSMYLSGGQGSSVVRSSNLISRGLPDITLTWREIGSAEVKRKSLEAIFDCDDDVHGFSDAQGSVKEKPLDKVRAYFIAEMFLGAEMCMDRNYVAMHKLDTLFPYEALVTIIKLPVTSNIKAAAVRLLMCLHVDRDPQATSKIPMLTRTWSDIKQNPVPQLPYVDESRRCTFGLIQQMVSEHVRSMAGNRWDELSRHMLKMLRTMVQFNFYGTNERMRDVIGPLIMALDRRQVDFLSDFDPTKSFKASGARQHFSGGIGSMTFSGKMPTQLSSVDLVKTKGSFASVSPSDDDSDLDGSVDLRASSKGARREWWQRVLKRMDSIVFQVCVLLLVALDAFFDLYTLLTGGKFDVLTLPFLLEASLLTVFVVEVLVRAYATHATQGTLRDIYTSPFHMLDIFSILANIVFLLLVPFTIHLGGSFVIALRLVNACRLLYHMYLTKEKGDMLLTHTTSLDSVKIALRYRRAPMYELETMVEAVDILAFMQRLIEDRNISLIMHYFHKFENGSDRRGPSELFEQVVMDSQELSLHIADFDNVMIDVLMFNNSPLVQSALEVLMAHHSMRSTLLRNAKQIQLLAAAKREKQYHSVNQMLQELEQNAETHELWGELASDGDRATNKRSKEILSELIDICRVRHFVLEFDEDFMADTEIQDLYRNLGCFEICMKVMGLLDSVEENEEGELDEVALNTRHLCLLCNTLLYWFFLGNPLNQELGYAELDFFLDTLDDMINSHLVIGAIFKNNESLMRVVPHSHLSDLVDRIVKNGKSHHYLALFAAISNVGDKNIVENQFQIVKILTSPGRLQKVAWAFVPVDHPEYQEKRELMAPFLDKTSDLSIDDLPPLLAYHLMFLDVLSDCTVGRLNITTVEAKVQSVFNYVDILQSILDPGTITFTKSRLSMFFYNSIIEVELKIPGLEQSAYIWHLLQSYTHVLGYAKDELRTVEKVGWESEEVSRQRIEYIIVCVLITGGFFARYYDAATFRFNESGGGTATDKVHISQEHVNELIASLFHKVKDIYDLDSPRLSEDMKEQIFGSLVALNKSSSKIIVSHLAPNDAPKASNVPQNNTVEAKLVHKYGAFVEQIARDADIMAAAENESVAFISILESLPTIADPVDADVRYETLIRKLVQHIRDNFKVSGGQKRLDPRVTKTATWIIRSFRTMIENRMGMGIDQRDEEGGAEEDEAAAPVVIALNSCGATTLCLDLIADGIDESLQLEAIKLGVGLLFKEGGALEVQGIMNNHLAKTQSELFFKQVRLTLQKLQAWHEWNQVIILEEDEEPSLPDEILIVRFLQLMCEGHYLPNQDIMREQPNNAVTYNLLDDYVNYLNCLSRIPCRTSTVAAIRLSATILEVIQGPCEGNQGAFALTTELIETLNRLNRAKMLNDCSKDDEVELKKTSIDIFQGLLEGQGEKSQVYERVLSVIHLDVIQMMSKGSILPDYVGENGKFVAEEATEDMEILQTECVVLVQMLCNFKPSLYEELGISKNIDDIVGSGTAMIEVIWRGDIHRRFFHIPAVCKFLAKSSKDALVENVDRANAENKLIDFLERSHELYREVKHQQLLTEVGVSGVFSRINQDRATWATFLTAVVINCLFVVYYDYAEEKTRPSVSSSTALAVINALNIFQNMVAAFVLILNLVVRMPVIYENNKAKDLSELQAIGLTASDPKTMYFCAYLALSLLGLLAADYYLPFLLLDIVAKNATTRDVLNAVVIPRQQLLMTVVLAIFVTYIFAYFIFKYFRDQLGGIWGDGIDPRSTDCVNLWGCFKFVLCYGIRQGGGVGDMMKLSIGKRWLIDICYFLIVIVMMLNIIFGIIIDTFSSLRAEKNERLEDTTGVCFICGIGDQVFDRASDEPDGFQTHVKLEHNMWNYLYFIFMLWEQDKDDDDGLEQYVRRAIDAKEIVWFPLNKALRLDQAATEEEVTMKELERELDEYESTLLQRISHLHSEMSHVLDNISSATKMQHERGGVKDGISSFLRESLKTISVQEEAADAPDAGLELESIDEETHGDDSADEEHTMDRVTEEEEASGSEAEEAEEEEEDVRNLSKEEDSFRPFHINTLKRSRTGSDDDSSIGFPSHSTTTTPTAHSHRQDEDAYLVPEEVPGEVPEEVPGEVPEKEEYPGSRRVKFDILFPVSEYVSAESTATAAEPVSEPTATERTAAEPTAAEPTAAEPTAETGIELTAVEPTAAEPTADFIIEPTDELGWDDPDTDAPTDLPVDATSEEGSDKPKTSGTSGRVAFEEGPPIAPPAEEEEEPSHADGPAAESVRDLLAASLDSRRNAGPESQSTTAAARSSAVEGETEAEEADYHTYGDEADNEAEATGVGDVAEGYHTYADADADNEAEASGVGEDLRLESVSSEQYAAIAPEPLPAPIDTALAPLLESQPAQSEAQMEPAPTEGIFRSEAPPELTPGPGPIAAQESVEGAGVDFEQIDELGGK